MLRRLVTPTVLTAGLVMAMGAVAAPAAADTVEAPTTQEIVE